MKIHLHSHQLSAIDAWFNNSRHGIISMATGTGKTFTAIGAVDKLFKEVEKNAVFISAPYSHLVTQWKISIERYDLKADSVIECHSGIPNWYERAVNALRKVKLGIFKSVIFLSTHNTIVGEKMNNLIEEIALDKVAKLTIIADEVHGIGSRMRRENLSNHFENRLGLSATPKRMYDEVGNSFLHEYFGEVVFEFSLCQAVNNVNPDTLRTYLTPYYYYPIPCYLTDEEMKKYSEVTEKIIKKANYLQKFNYGDLEDDPELQKLLFKRSKILKASVSKYEALHRILNLLKAHGKIRKTIIFCDEHLIDQVMDILNAEKITAVKFIQELSKQEREYVLKLFEEEQIDILVGIKMLDEGVDVPGVDKAIILSSSTNPREYIQKLGRVLRIAPAKKFAYVYDVVVFPKPTGFESDRVYKRILEVEFSRVEIMAQCAENAFEAIRSVSEIKRGFFI